MKINHIWNWNLTCRNDILWFIFFCPFTKVCSQVARNHCRVFTLHGDEEISASSQQHPRLETNSGALCIFHLCLQPFSQIHFLITSKITHHFCNCEKSKQTAKEQQQPSAVKISAWSSKVDQVVSSPQVQNWQLIQQDFKGNFWPGRGGR